jgi:hypothetical protein
MSDNKEQSNIGDDDEKLDFAMAGYAMKLHWIQAMAQRAPRVKPQLGLGRTSQSQQRGKRNKVYCVLWGSGDLIADPEFDSSILIPFGNDGMPSLAAVRKALLVAGKDRTCVNYLALSNRLNEAVRVYDLPTLGFKLISLPDPRPKSLLESTESRINIPLANDDNRLACVYSKLKMISTWHSFKTFSAQSSSCFAQHHADKISKWSICKPSITAT